ncbi:hypothetical protein ELI44_04160 [Rhizobium ruizarguesonis]|uniref:hypothetical protein n=1 Tax=Rhizobium ruizarguesonis TaxID=2081791 RepID=UPI0010314E40|nr:hypothetical protein [Rhizobium ruizarguesonis]TAU47274.1 hypothetical protein ELI42_04135 [Rhizobium ruizarguesonis]TAU62347.1 hypothetical protein ELI44_04160 [Rhizobium ruizarguesonis]
MSLINLLNSAVDRFYSELSFKIIRRVNQIGIGVSVSLFLIELYGVFTHPVSQSIIASSVAYAALHAPLLVKALAILSILILFSFRGYIPIGYGSLETAVGVIVILNTPDIAQPSIPAIIPLLTGAYIGVRGLDNIAKGLQKDGRLGITFGLLFNNPAPEKKTAP